jgi:hypothetical protein
LIVGSVNEYEAANLLMKTAGMQERVVGRISTVQNESPHSIGQISNIKAFINSYSIKEVILCHGEMSYEQIISLVSSIPYNIKKKFYSCGARSIIGSDNKNMSGDTIESSGFSKHETAVFKRNKKLADAIISLSLITTFPIHLLIQSKPFQFFKNLFQVIKGGKTWVGYSAIRPNLPNLPPGIISATGSPLHLHALPLENSTAVDEWYVLDYTIWTDLKLIWKNYKYLDT